MPTKQTTFKWALVGLVFGLTISALIIYQEGLHKYKGGLDIDLFISCTAVTFTSICTMALVPWLWIWGKSLVSFVIRETSDATLHRRLLKTKQLYDAGVLTEAEYKERLARIKAR